MSFLDELEKLHQEDMASNQQNKSMSPATSQGISPDFLGELESIHQQSVKSQTDADVASRGVMGDISASAVRGPFSYATQTVPQMVRAVTEPGGTVHEGMKSLQEWGKKQEETTPILRAPEPEGEVAKGVYGGLESVGQSLSARAIPAIAGGLIGGPVGALVGLALGGAPQFAAAQYQDVLDRADKQGIPRDQSEPVARMSALSEGLTEFGSDVVDSVLIGTRFVPKQLKKEAITSVGKLLGRGFKNFLGLEAGTALSEVPSEMANAAIQAEQEKKIGLGTQGGWDAAKQAFGPSLVAGLIFGAMGEAGIRADTWRTKRTLENPNSNPEARSAIAQNIFEDLQKVDSNIADAWGKSAFQAINEGKSISTNEDLVELERKIFNLQNIPEDQRTEKQQANLEALQLEHTKLLPPPSQAWQEGIQEDRMQALRQIEGEDRKGLPYPQRPWEGPTGTEFTMGGPYSAYSPEQAEAIRGQRALPAGQEFIFRGAPEDVYSPYSPEFAQAVQGRPALPPQATGFVLPPSEQQQVDVIDTRIKNLGDQLDLYQKHLERVSDPSVQRKVQDRITRLEVQIGQNQLQRDEILRKNTQQAIQPGMFTQQEGVVRRPDQTYPRGQQYVSGIEQPGVTFEYPGQLTPPPLEKTPVSDALNQSVEALKADDVALGSIAPELSTPAQKQSQTPSITQEIPNAQTIPSNQGEVPLGGIGGGRGTVPGGSNLRGNVQGQVEGGQAVAVRPGETGRTEGVLGQEGHEVEPRLISKGVESNPETFQDDLYNARQSLAKSQGELKTAAGTKRNVILMGMNDTRKRIQDLESRWEVWSKANPDESSKYQADQQKIANIKPGDKVLWTNQDKPLTVVKVNKNTLRLGYEVDGRDYTFEDLVPKTSVKPYREPQGEQAWAANQNLSQGQGEPIPPSQMTREQLRSQVIVPATEAQTQEQVDIGKQVPLMREGIEKRRAQLAQTEEVPSGQQKEAVQKEGKEAVTAADRGAEGKEVKAYMPDGSHIDVTYTLRDASELITSHDHNGNVNPDYPAELQPRDRERGTSKLQIQQMAQNLNPELLGESAKVSDGAPIIGPDNVVESGNGRTAAVRLAYREGNAVQYKQWLNDNAERFSLTQEQVHSIENPVLVRQRTSEVNRADFARKANQADLAAMSPAELARSDANRITDSMLEMFKPSEDGNVFAASNHNFVQQFLKTLGQQESAQYFTKESGYTKQLADRIQAAVFAKAYGDERLLGLMAEEADPGIKNILNALNMAAPNFAKVQARNPGKDIDITPRIVEAATVVKTAKNRGISVKDILAQQNMFQQIHPDAKLLAAFIDENMRSAKRMGEFFSHIGNMILSEMNRTQNLEMFPRKKVTARDIIESSLKRMESQYGEQGRQQSLFARSADAGGNAQGERVPVGRTTTGVAGRGRWPGGVKETQETLRAEETQKGRRRLETQGQINMFWPDSLPLPRRADIHGGTGRPGPGEGPFRTVGKAFTDIKKTEVVDLSGLTIHSIEDLAELAQNWRNPNYEELRYVFLSRGEDSSTIIYHEGVSCRIPGSTKAFLQENREEGIRWLDDIVRSLGANSVILVHNHPSGDVTPSKQDLNLTRQLKQRIPEIDGHIVINGGQFAYFKEGFSHRVQIKQLPSATKEGWSDPILKPSIPHEGLGKKITSNVALAQWAKSLQRVTPNAPVIIYLDSNLRVRGIQEVDRKVFFDPKVMRREMPGKAVEFGVSAMVVHVPGRNSAEEIVTLNGYVSEGVFWDVLYDNPTEQTMSVTENLRLGPPDWHILGGKRREEFRTVSVRENQKAYEAKGIDYASTEKEPVTSIQGEDRFDGRTNAATEAAEQVAILDVARFKDRQRIVTIKEAQDWLEDHGFPRVAEAGESSDLIESLVKNPDFNQLSIFDRIRVAAQLERPIRDKDYAPVAAPTENKKLKGKLGTPGQNKKMVGSGIYAADTVVGCDHFCYECYALKGAAQVKISHQHPVLRQLEGTIKTGQTLRLGEVGDPSRNWEHTHEQVNALLDRSRKAGANVSATSNVFYITKLLNVNGFNPDTAKNLQVTLDPMYPDHMWRSMQNILRIKSAYPDTNITVRVRSFATFNEELNDSQKAAIDFANRFNLPVLETRMRFIRKSSFDLLELDPSRYKHDGNQFKMQGNNYSEDAERHYLCDSKLEGCPGCKNCIKTLARYNRSNFIKPQNDAISGEGIDSVPIGMTSFFDPTGGATKFSLKEGEAQPTGVPLSEAKSAIDPIAKHLESKLVGGVNVVETFDDLPGRIKAAATSLDYWREEGGARLGESEVLLRGLYDPVEDSVYLVSANNESIDELQRTFLHEGGHVAQKYIFSQPEAQRFFSELYAVKGDQIKPYASPYGFDLSTKEGRIDSATEWWMDQIGEGNFDQRGLRGWWNRFVRMFNEGLRKLGFTVQLSDSELADMMRRFRREILGDNAADSLTFDTTTKFSLLEKEYAPDFNRGTFDPNNPDIRFSLRSKAEDIHKAVMGEPKEVRDVVFGKDADMRDLRDQFRIVPWIAKTNETVRKLFNIQNNRDKERKESYLRSLTTAQSVFDLPKQNQDEFRKLTFDLENKEVVKTSKFEKVGEEVVQVGKFDKTFNVYDLNPKHYEELEDYLDKRGVSEPVRNAYIDMRRVLDRALLETYNKMNRLEHVDQNLIDQFRQSMGQIHNYFPHQRYGNSYIQAVDSKGNVVYRQHFNAIGDQTRRRWYNKNIDQLVSTLKEQHKDVDWDNVRWRVDKVKGLPEEVYDYPIPVDAIQQVINGAVDRIPADSPEAKNALRSLLSEEVANTMKSRGYGQHMITRKNIPGFEQNDINRVLHDYLAGHSGWLTKMEAAKDFSQILGKIPAKQKPNEYKYAVNYVHDMLQNQTNIDRWVDNARSFFFMKYLGGNIKTAVLNLTQNAIAGVPRLSMDTGGVRATAQFGKAMKDIRVAITEKSIAANQRISAEERRFLGEMYSEGWGQAQLINEATGKMGGTGKMLFGKAARVMGFPMELAERYNRMSLGLAAFRAARNGQVTNRETLDSLNLKSGEKASYDVAKQFSETVVNDAHFVYGKGARPAIMRGTSTGKALSSSYTFRSFSHNLLSLWRWMLTQGGREGRKAFAYSLGSIMVLGGVSSIPLYATIAGLMRQLFGEDWLGKELREATPKHMRDLVMYGAPSIAGVNFGGSLGMELPVIEKIRTDQSISSQMGSAIGDLVGIPWAVLEEFSNAVDAARRGDLYRTTEILSPTALKNIMTAHRLATQGQTAATGRPINLPGEEGPRKLTTEEAIGRGFGFQPLSSTKAYEVYKSLEDLKNYKDVKQNELATQYMRAKNSGDTEGMQDVVREVNKWNLRMLEEKRPQFRIDLKASIAARSKTKQPPKQMQSFAKEMVEAYK